MSFTIEASSPVRVTLHTNTPATNPHQLDKLKYRSLDKMFQVKTADGCPSAVSVYLSTFLIRIHPVTKAIIFGSHTASMAGMTWPFPRASRNVMMA